MDNTQEQKPKCNYATVRQVQFIKDKVDRMCASIQQVETLQASIELHEEEMRLLLKSFESLTREINEVSDNIERLDPTGMSLTSHRKREPWRGLNRTLAG